MNHSLCPVAMAGGIALLLFGVVTSLSFSVVGAALIVGALVGWMRDLVHVQRE